MKGNTNMKNQEKIIRKVCRKAYKMLSRNKYYTSKDFMHAYNEIINNMYINGNFSKLNLCMKNGNLKLEKNIKIFNLPSIATCSCSCSKCYTLKAERMREKVRQHRARNLFIILLCQHDNDFKNTVQNYFVNEILQHGLLYNMPVVRVHESGDMFNGLYVNFWQEIINTCKNKNKNILFYTYTKFDNINLNSCNIIDSLFEIDGKKHINFGTIDYIVETALKLKKQGMDFSICGYKLNLLDIEKLSMHGLYNFVEFAKCGTCMACMQKRIVLFKVH